MTITPHTINRGQFFTVQALNDEPRHLTTIVNQVHVLQSEQAVRASGRPDEYSPLNPTTVRDALALLVIAGMAVRVKLDGRYHWTITRRGVDLRGQL